MNAEIVARLERSFAPQDAGLKADGFDVTAFMAMAVVLLADESSSPELKQAVKARALEFARPLMEKAVFSKAGPSTVEPK